MFFPQTSPSAHAVKAKALLLSSEQYLYSLLGLIVQTPYDFYFHTAPEINCYIRHVCLSVRLSQQQR